MTVRIFGENGAMILLNIVIDVSSVNGANMIHIHGKMESVPYVDMDLNIIQYWTFKSAGNHPLNVDCLHFYSQFIFISSLFRSIYFHLMFPPLCPFSSVLFRISFWFPDDFGLFYAFSVLYVHFLLLSSVFLSGFRMILDFFTAFSRLYVHFHLLGSVFPSSFRMILDFFPIFLSFMSIWKSTEVSGLRNAALRRIKRSAITAFLFQKLLSQLPS